jgi:hypothetical protein
VPYTSENQRRAQAQARKQQYARPRGIDDGEAADGTAKDEAEDGAKDGADDAADDAGGDEQCGNDSCSDDEEDYQSVGQLVEYDIADALCALRRHTTQFISYVDNLIHCVYVLFRQRGSERGLLRFRAIAGEGRFGGRGEVLTG